MYELMFHGIRSTANVCFPSRSSYPWHALPHCSLAGKHVRGGTSVLTRVRVATRLQIVRLVVHADVHIAARICTSSMLSSHPPQSG